MQRTSSFFQPIFISLLFVFCSCNKPKTAEAPNSSATLNSGRAGITFTTNSEFGASKVFKIINTSQTTAITQPVGATKRYMVLIAEESYGSLGDTRKATIYITVPVPTSVPVLIDLKTPLSTVPSAQVELYYTITGGLFGNTYRSGSGQISIAKLTATEIEGSFSAAVSSSIPPGYSVANGTFAGKF